MASSAEYCGVKPQRLATFTSMTTLPLKEASGVDWPSMLFSVKSKTLLSAAISPAAQKSRQNSTCEIILGIFPRSRWFFHSFCGHRQIKSETDASQARPLGPQTYREYSMVARKKTTKYAPGNYRCPADFVLAPANHPRPIEP